MHLVAGANVLAVVMGVLVLHRRAQGGIAVFQRLLRVS
jgi:hypothetical protein